MFVWMKASPEWQVVMPRCRQKTHTQTEIIIFDEHMRGHKYIKKKKNNVHIWKDSSSQQVRCVHGDDALHKLEPGVITLSLSTVIHAVGVKVCELSLNMM